MATSARQNRIRFHGASTGFTTQAMSLVAGKLYRLSNAAMRVLDPSRPAGVEVYDNGVLVDPAQYTVDWMFGTVTFAAAYTPTGPVTMTGSYFPMVEVSDVREHSLSVSVDALDATVYGNDAKVRQAGLADVSGSFTALIRDTAVIGTTRALDALRTMPFVFEKQYADGSFFRAWVTAESVETSGSASGLIETTVNFVGAAQNAPGEPGEGTGFGWSAV